MKNCMSRGFLFILLFFISYVNSHGQYELYDRSYDKGNKLLYENYNYEEAINIFNETLKLQAPNGVNLGWLGMGNAYFLSKKYNEAISCYNNLLEQAANPIGQCQLGNPTNYNGVKYCLVREGFAAVHNYLSQSYENIGNIEMALNSYNAAISINPSSELFQRRGNIYNSQHKIHEAISDYKQFINHKETSVKNKIEMTNNVIQYLESIEDYSFLYDFLKDIRDKNAEQYNKFAFASYKLEKYEDADRYYNEALRLQPSLAIDAAARKASQEFIAEKKRKEQQEREEAEARRIAKIKSAQVGDKLVYSETWRWSEGFWIFESSGAYTMKVTCFIERIEGERYQLRVGDITSSSRDRSAETIINGVRAKKGDLIWARPLNGNQWIYEESF